MLRNLPLKTSGWFVAVSSNIFQEIFVPHSSLNSVGAKASLWSKVANQHLEKQSLNPFSDTFDREKLKGLLCSKDDPNYGRPDQNSASAIRAAAGEAKMRGEICDVCEVIFNHGQRTEGGEAAIQFGELFSVRFFEL